MTPFGDRFRKVSVEKRGLDRSLRAFGAAPGLTLLSVLSASAADGTAPASPVNNVEMDAAFLATSLRSTSEDASVTLAPSGSVDASGLRLNVTTSESSYEMIESDKPLLIGDGHDTEADLFAGYDWTLNNISITGFLGPSFIQEVQDSPRVVTTAAGAKVLASFYATPTTQTMAFGTASYSTFENTYYTFLKVGLKIPIGAYLGPEASLSGSRTYRQARVGVHMSGLKVGPVLLGVYGGYVQDYKIGDGEYAGLNLYGAF